MTDLHACGYCRGYGRDGEGSRCQDCGGSGLCDGSSLKIHPRAFLVRFHSICMGWRSADFDKITAAIEAAADHMKRYDVTLDGLTSEDRELVRVMIERQVQLAINSGDFATIGIPAGTILGRDLDGKTTMEAPRAVTESDGRAD